MSDWRCENETYNAVNFHKIWLVITPLVYRYCISLILKIRRREITVISMALWIKGIVALNLSFDNDSKILSTLHLYHKTSLSREMTQAQRACSPITINEITSMKILQGNAIHQRNDANILKKIIVERNIWEINNKKLPKIHVIVGIFLKNIMKSIVKWKIWRVARRAIFQATYLLNHAMHH